MSGSCPIAELTKNWCPDHADAVLAEISALKAEGLALQQSSASYVVENPFEADSDSSVRPKA